MSTSVDAHSLLSRVTRVLGVRSGKPIIVGTRVTVWDLVGRLTGGMSEAEILEDFPYLEKRRHTDGYFLCRPTWKSSNR